MTKVDEMQNLVSEIVQTISSREVAEMMEVQHKHLLEKIDKINEDLVAENLATKKYWIESTFENRGKQYREYQVTKLGCEFLAHKSTGTKGNIFTARYMDRFEEMEQYIKEQNKPSYMIDDRVKRAEKWIEEEKQRQQLQLENEEQTRVIQIQSDVIEEMKPMALVGECLEVSKDSILVRELAKLLKQNGIDIGQNRLFEWLRDNGYLIKSGSDKNMPTQKAMNLKLFEIKHTNVICNGESKIRKTTMVTGKGQAYFIKKFKKVS